MLVKRYPLLIIETFLLSFSLIARSNDRAFLFSLPVSRTVFDCLTVLLLAVFVGRFAFFRLLFILADYDVY